MTGEGDVIGEPERGVVGEHEVGALGRLDTEAGGGEALHQDVPAAPVAGDEFGEVLGGSCQGGHRPVLQRGGHGEGDELVGGAHRVGQVRRADRPPHLPAGKRERLPQRRQCHGALPHAGERGDGDVLPFEHEVLVHLVGDDDGVVGDGHRGHQLELGTVEDATHRVVRGVEHDHAGAGADDAGQVGLVEAERRRAQRHVSCGRTGHGDPRRIEVVERLDEHHLVAGVDHPEKAGCQRFGAARGHGDVVVRVDGDPGGGGETGGDHLPQLRDARHRGVLVVAAGHRRRRCRLDEFGPSRNPGCPGQG